MDGEYLRHGTLPDYLYEATGDEKYWDVVMSKVHYIREEALRFGDHVLQHTVSANNDFRNRPGRTLCSWRLFSCFAWA